MMTFIETGDWFYLQVCARAVRTAVFVDEQGIANEDEWDAEDATALHAVLFDEEGLPLGNARLLHTGGSIAKVGRMAVLRHARGQGYGRRLLQAMLREAHRRGHAQVRLHAQCAAQGFYTAQGFCVVGEPFDEAGIAHVEMVRDLTGFSRT